MNLSVCSVFTLGIGMAPLLALAADGEASASAGAKASSTEKRCLSLGRIRSTRVLDDQNVVFVMRAKPDYINTLPYRCPGLGFYKSFGYRTGTSSVCDLDSITVLESGRRGASCGLGTFSEYVPEAAAEQSEDQGGEE